jgi:hypothetical protein
MKIVRLDELNRENGEYIMGREIDDYVTEAKADSARALKREKRDRQYYSQYIISSRREGVTTAPDGYYLIGYEDCDCDYDNHWLTPFSKIEENHEISINFLKKIGGGFLVKENTPKILKDLDKIIDPDF